MVDDIALMHGSRMINSIELQTTIETLSEFNNCMFGDKNPVTMEEIICLLRELQPHILSMDELVNLKRNDVVWIEDIDKDEIIPAIVSDSIWEHIAKAGKSDFKFIVNDRMVVRADRIDYFVRWRCWSICPNDLQRKEVAWK